MATSDSVDYTSIQVERAPAGWATIALHRPEKLNTLSIQLRKELDHAVRNLEEDPDIHVLILTGTGKAFTAGMDLDEWNATDEPAASAYTYDAVASLQRFSGPVIAAVNGFAVTGGLEIILACDLIIAARDARFADTHVRVGLLPGWGGSARMVQCVGLHRAKELALTGRFFSAQEALQWGVVNHVVEPDQLLPFTKSLALDMLKSKPQYLKAYKSLLDAESMLTLEDALLLERARSRALNSQASLEEIQDRLRQFRRG